MPHLCGHGITIDLPRGWDGRITHRGGECALPVLHASSLPLPHERADSGGGAVERLGWGDVFLTLQEHEPAGAGNALFAAQGVPVPFRVEWFRPRALHGMRPLQSGAQRFFTVGGRAFSLFVVVGEHARRARLLPAVNRALATLSVEPPR